MLVANYGHETEVAGKYFEYLKAVMVLLDFLEVLVKFIELLTMF